ncbi:antibiotic biosynthesis monooxygenase [Paraburkholderia guartelaensis]|uniref:Antibiotic biosynthesis monooxygenase n=1 Tax=Paraburkholderia guartelaensis TaxID=2546446 RepID=A0A4R5LKH3_9BURK|nr:putative quinol monooxygenase [Paraburkholderia guartelaensis]TDG10248.1 antibiotic biosynthesis monooxygenase [Paraburkholderia guartelaensis]
MNISVFASIVPKQEHVKDVEEELLRMVSASRKEPGNLRYDLYRISEGPTSFHLFETYDGPAAMDAHRASAHYQNYRAKVVNWLLSTPDVKVLSAVEAAS